MKRSEPDFSREEKIELVRQTLPDTDPDAICYRDIKFPVNYVIHSLCVLYPNIDTLNSYIGKRKKWSPKDKEAAIFNSAEVCHYCEEDLNAVDQIHIDHSVPLSKGGTNHESNLFAACIDCNTSKADKAWFWAYNELSDDYILIKLDKWTSPRKWQNILNERGFMGYSPDLPNKKAYFE